VSGPWEEVALADLLSVPVTYGIVQPGNNVDDGVPILRVNNLRDGVITAGSAIRVSPEVARVYSRTSLRGGEVVVSLVGTVGEAAVVPNELRGWNVARAVGVLRPAKVSATWLCICMQSRPVQRQLRDRVNTTVQTTLNLKDLAAVRIPVPSEPEQRAIAELLGALDDKTAANRLLIAAADDLRAMRFRALLGPDAARLSDLAQFVNGKAFTNGASGTGRVVIRIAELNSGIGGSTVYNDIDVAEDHLARPGDLLFAWSGSLTVHRWFRQEGIINQHIFKVIPTRDIPVWVVEGALQERLAEFRSIAADKATTMGHIQRRHLDERVSVPSPQSIANEHALMQALWNLALAAELETLVLSSTRDELLPLIMSGKVRVRDVERVVEGVV